MKVSVSDLQKHTRFTDWTPRGNYAALDKDFKYSSPFRI